MIRTKKPGVGQIMARKSVSTETPVDFKRVPASGADFHILQTAEIKKTALVTEKKAVTVAAPIGPNLGISKRYAKKATGTVGPMILNGQPGFPLAMRIAEAVEMINHASAAKISNARIEEAGEYCAPYIKVTISEAAPAVIAANGKSQTTQRKA